MKVFEWYLYLGIFLFVSIPYFMIFVSQQTRRFGRGIRYHTYDMDMHLKVIFIRELEKSLDDVAANGWPEKTKDTKNYSCKPPHKGAACVT